MQGIHQDVLCSLSLYEVLRYLEFPQLPILFEGDGNDLCPVDADVVILQQQTFQGFVLEEDCG